MYCVVKIKIDIKVLPWIKRARLTNEKIWLNVVIETFTILKCFSATIASFIIKINNNPEGKKRISWTKILNFHIYATLSIKNCRSWPYVSIDLIFRDSTRVWHCAVFVLKLSKCLNQLELHLIFVHVRNYTCQKLIFFSYKSVS